MKRLIFLLASLVMVLSGCDDGIKLDDIKLDLNGTWVRTAIFADGSTVDQSDKISYACDVKMRKQAHGFQVEFNRSYFEEGTYASFSNGVLDMPDGKDFGWTSSFYAKGLVIEDGVIHLPNEDYKVDKGQDIRLEYITDDKVKLINLQTNDMGGHIPAEDLSGVYERVNRTD